MKLGPMDFNQPSTWRGLIGLAAIGGISVSPAIAEQIALLAAALIALIEMFRDEYRKKPSAPTETPAPSAEITQKNPVGFDPARYGQHATCSKPQTSAPWRANNAISSPDYVPIRGVSNPDYWPINPHSLPTARKHRLRPTFTANGTNSRSIIGLVLIAIGYLLLVGQTPVQAPRHRTGKTVVFSDPSVDQHRRVAVPPFCFLRPLRRAFKVRGGA